MVFFLDLLISFVSAAVFLFPILLLLESTLFKPASVRRMVLVLLFGCYLAELFAIVGTPSVLYATFDPTVNWVPLVDIVNAPSAYLRNSILNILLFVPLGVFLPLLWPAFRSWKKTALVGLGVSSSVEILQLFTHRLTDVDDLITNTLGTILGFALAAWLLRRRSIGPRQPRPKWELPAVVVSVLLVKTFAAPFLSDFLWEAVL